MSATQTTPQPGSFIERFEECRCIRCKSVIPNHQVQKNLLEPQGAGPTQQRVLAWCRHCDVIYCAIRDLRGGEYLAPGSFRILSDPREIASAKRKFEALAGEVQAKDLPPVKVAG
jgi:hypothetical protein